MSACSSASSGSSRRRATAYLVERQPASGETELVGRSQEIEQLCAELTGAASGTGRVVAVLGEAGIGKSRLVGELADHATRRGMAVLIGRSYESEQILPFGPWVDALRAGHLADDAELPARLTDAQAERFWKGVSAEAERGRLAVFAAAEDAVAHLAKPRRRAPAARRRARPRRRPPG